MTPVIQVQKLHPAAILPTQAYPGDAGWDLHVLQGEFIEAGTGKDIRTGIAVAIPEGYYGRIVGRSSALRRRGLIVIEGIIDAGFRGELFSYVYCPVDGQSQLRGGRKVEAGWSLAQLILVPVPQVEWTEVQELPESERGTAGFGSSGR